MKTNLTLRALLWLAATLLGTRAVQADPVLVYAAQTQPGGAFGLYWTVNGGRTPPLAMQGPLGLTVNVFEYDFVPRSSAVVYRASQSPSGPTELYIGGTTPALSGRKISAPLAAGRSVTQFALSANSTSLAYIADGATTAGVFQVYATRTEGTLAPQQVNAAPAVSGGNVVDVAVSPNGRWLAYRGDLLLDGKFEVFASAIPTTTTWRLNMSLAANEDVNNFAFSPDSAKLAFLINQSDGASGLRHRLFTRAIQGSGAVTPIADTGAGIGNVVDYMYSLSGSKIALLEDRETSGHFELYLTNADGSGGTTKISAPLAAGKNVLTFGFSPDGLWLAYTANVAGPFAAQGELFLYSIAGGGSPVKVNQDALGSAALFAFSADSKHLVYQQSPVASSNFNLYERPTTLASAEHKINSAATTGQSIDQFAIGADNKYVAYIGDNTNVGNLYVMALDGTGSELQVNPAGQSVAAILTAPVDSRSASDANWNRYE